MNLFLHFLHFFMISHNVITAECFWLISTIIKRWDKNIIYWKKSKHINMLQILVIVWWQESKKYLFSGKLDCDTPLSFSISDLIFLENTFFKYLLLILISTFLFYLFYWVLKFLFLIFKNIHHHTAVVHYSYE